MGFNGQFDDDLCRSHAGEMLCIWSIYISYELPIDHLWFLTTLAMARDLGFCAVLRAGSHSFSFC